MIRTMKELCALRGVSGHEDEVRSYISEKVSKFADEIVTDGMGNLMVFKKGARRPERPLLIAAHMDEVGLIITGITDEGFLRFDFAGGVDRRVIIGKRVNIGQQGIPGVVALRAWHHFEGDEREKIPKTEAMLIDIGAAGRVEAEARVSLGDYAVFGGESLEFGDGFIKARAIDDRFGCAVMIKLLEGELPCDAWFAFTVQEELGTRGATVAAHRLAPEAAIVIEGTTAADLPGVSDGKKITVLGGGAVIPYMDRGAIYDRELFARLTALADERGIPWQTKSVIAGGTDGSAIQKSRGGVKTAVIAAPVRNIHSPACVAKISDLENVHELARAFLEEWN